jgi:hypothetical protein
MKPFAFEAIEVKVGHPHRSGVEPVRAVLAEVVLNGRREAAHADRGDDPRRAALVDELEAGDVLALGRKCVRRARPGPVDAAVVGDEQPSLRAGDHLAARIRVDAHLADGVVLRELAGRLRVGHPEDAFAEERPGRTAIRGLQNPLAAHRERAVVQVSRARVDRVVVGGVDRDRVDADRRDEWVVCRDVPRRRAAAAVRRLPDAAADAGGISDDGAVAGRRRVDGDPVDPALREAVVVAAGTAGHALGPRAERGPIRSMRPVLAGGHAAADARVVTCGRAHPGGVEDACRVREPVVPVGGGHQEVLRLLCPRRHADIVLG